MNKMNEDMLKQIIIDTIKGEEHLGENLKEQCVYYINELESQQANNYFFQGGRGSGKTYITKLEQQLNLYKEVIEEVKRVLRCNNIEVLKYYDEPSETGSYEIVTVDLLQILDKSKG